MVEGVRATPGVPLVTVRPWSFQRDPDPHIGAHRPRIMQRSLPTRVSKKGMRKLLEVVRTPTERDKETVITLLRACGLRTYEGGDHASPRAGLRLAHCVTHRAVLEVDLYLQSYFTLLVPRFVDETSFLKSRYVSRKRFRMRVEKG